jgi:uncharacterized DUF497 family protein
MMFEWNPKKNEWLKEKRGISFEEIALLLGAGQLWRVADHWNQDKYPGQEIFFIPIRGYIYLVPYVIDNDTIFLKAAIPSRKATREYRQEIGEQYESI